MGSGKVISLILLTPFVVVDLVFTAILYWTGYLFLKLITVGYLRLAHLSASGQGIKKSKNPKVLLHCFWIPLPDGRLALNPGWTCAAGMIIWLGAGLTYHFMNK